MKSPKRIWGYTVALLITMTILVFPLDWIYQLVQRRAGTESALVALTITVAAILILGIRGGMEAHRINRILREEAASKARTQPGNDSKPVVLEVFGMELLHYEHPIAESQKESSIIEKEIQQLVSCPRKRRGKQPRFPEDKIRKAVLKWERRDPSFSARTLEEFLELEFGCGPDGILLMAPSTFYDWRRAVLKEIEAQQKNH
ncbi:MAG: hypothetical protein HYR70_00425 [Chloroflexi bacterium]|nr:hypothetical protein [Chloroflexota bacterium]